MGASAQPRSSRLPESWRPFRGRPVSKPLKLVTRDPVGSARAAGLLYTTDAKPGIRRRRRGSGFTYITPAGRVLRDPKELYRIRALAIPPAWTDVWICPDPRGHLQATGRDARGRKQHRYHARWRDVRDETKYQGMIGFAEALPAIRRRTEMDLRKPGLPKEKVLAAVVQLLEKTLIRVGNDEYVRQNRSFGLTTLRDAHVRVSGARVRFAFRGKSGVAHEVDLDDRRLARIVKACRDIPGYELFQYIAADGERQTIGSSDVNEYLKDATGEEYTSKDFRTWAGTVLAAELLEGIGSSRSQSEAKRSIVRAVESVASRLGNTKAVCRKCYIHPIVFDAYQSGTIFRSSRRGGYALRGLSKRECAVLQLLRSSRFAPAEQRRAS
jgi:DNA topoisomerase-1